MTSQAEFESIYSEYKSLVFNVCLHYVLNREDAQDLAQEVFVKIYHHLGQYDSETAYLKTWIYRIAINQSLDFLKAKKRKKRFGFITSLFHPESNELAHDVAKVSHPGVPLEEQESMEELLQIIYALPEKQKTAIILAKIEDRPQKEVAEIMHTSVKAVESLLQRAKQTIEKKLKGSEGF
ncbi:RNA polymerase sigma factor [Pontibacter sp. E15-1]|uniref:RNA polymerase sigma factor n=1 Tax=Pontibacter sp. E15-1 TaxID=2919918 RepID=UPI001F4F8F76|nr:RNA polymerase sigma factor [Pontibacter sp. E15-1]MCJ8163479.1 RNA polymerase sigma factor [Pontibacter sp. E15-1]